VKIKLVGLFVICLAISSCSSSFPGFSTRYNDDRINGSYGYIPLTGLSVDQNRKADSCKENPEWKPILQALPNITSRFALANIQANGTISFGASQTTVEGQRYRAVVDYINVDTVPFTVAISAVIDEKTVPLSKALRDVEQDPSLFISSYNLDFVGQYEEKTARETFENNEQSIVTFPVYVGIGMRLTAEIDALKGKVSLSGLSAIAAEASAGKLTGFMTSEMIGINGSAIAVSLPIPSKIDQTTVESGILAIGASRAAFLAPDRDPKEVTLTPQVVGLYSPVGTDPQLVNAIYSLMAKERVEWRRPCQEANSPAKS